MGRILMLVRQTLTIIAALSIVAGCSRPQPSRSAGPKPTAVHSCLPKSALLSTSKPFYPNAEQTKDYLRSYADPYVIGLRSTLDAYAAGRADDETTKSLSPFGKTLAQDHFTVLSIDQGLFGGSWISATFTKHPATLYKAWVYMLGHTTPTLRALTATHCTPEEQRFLATRYGSMYALGDDSTLIAASATMTPTPQRSQPSSVVPGSGLPPNVANPNGVADPRVFHGFPCTGDCSGHEAGYQWAQDHDINDPHECYSGPKLSDPDNESFSEGCEAYVDEETGVEPLDPSERYSSSDSSNDDSSQ